MGCCLLLVGRITNLLTFEISAANLSSTSFQRQKRLQKRLRWNQPKACQALEADQACFQFGDTILECNQWTADTSTTRHPRFLSFFIASIKEISTLPMRAPVHLVVIAAISVGTAAYPVHAQDLNSKSFEAKKEQKLNKAEAKLRKAQSKVDCIRASKDMDQLKMCRK